jgi:protein-tyrosine-phosphatase
VAEAASQAVNPGQRSARANRASRPTRVLFLCTHNSARSQMAEGLLRAMGGSLVEAHSAGTVATRVHPLAIATMAARNIDISHHTSKHVDAFAGQAFDAVVTVCDNAKESCPLFPGGPERIHWSIPDPSAVHGDGADAAFQTAANDLSHRIGGLLAELARQGPGA